MKRRSADQSKPRRSLKRANKFTEGVYGSSFVYLKFVLIWCLVLLADFIIEFRFEYLWPFWLLIRSVCDSFRYQGLTLSAFFLCIAITSDMICLLLIPIQWLFFMASTYVWVQYIWHTDRGICLPTVSLWVLFMYIEATIRLRDLKNSIHVDLCRPFAAHCIGYPVVTLGFGFKSYVQYRLRLRAQRDIQKDNEFYFELLRSALPAGQQQNCGILPPEKNSTKGGETTQSSCNGEISPTVQQQTKKEKNQTIPRSHLFQDTNSAGKIPQLSSNEFSAVSETSMAKLNNNSMNNQQHPTTSSKKPQQQHHNGNLSNGCDGQIIPKTSSNISSTVMELRRRNTTSCSSLTSAISPVPSTKKGTVSTINSIYKESNNHLSMVSSSRSSSVSSRGSNSPRSTNKNSNCQSTANCYEKKAKPSEEEENNTDTTKSKYNNSRIEELESCVSQLRSELSSTRQCEGDLRMKNYTLQHDERSAKNELAQLRRDNEQLQIKFRTLMSNKQKDKQNLQFLEKRLKAEIEVREAVERALQDERKKRTEEDDIALATTRANENAEVQNLKNLHEMEKEFNVIKHQLHEKEGFCITLKNEIMELQHRQKAAKESETLMSALAAMQEKNLMLEKSLSAETRLKLDLFSALGDVKRQLDLAHSVIFKRDVEIGELKSRVADVLSVLPESQIRSTTPHYSNTFLEKQQSQQSVQLGATQHYSAGFCAIPVASSPLSPATIDPLSLIHASTMIPQSPGILQMPLDPNAAIYTPSSGI